MKPYTVTAGHSPDSPGAERDGLKEHVLMTELRDVVIRKIADLGVPVRGDGAKGINQPLANAMHLIAGSEAAIELHTNASIDPRARGVEVISLPKDKALAQKLAMSIATILQEPLRGDKGWIDQSDSARGRLGFVARGGLIVEVFFLSNIEARAKYLERKWLVASAIVKALTGLS